MPRSGGAQMIAPGEPVHSLPVNIDVERFVLGSILLNDELFPAAATALSVDSFSLEKHQRIWRRMADLRQRGEKVDRVTVAAELHGHGELEACGGLSYLVDLDVGLPQVPNLESYIRILDDKVARRRVIYACSDLMKRCNLGCEDLRDIVETGQDLFAGIVTRVQGYRSVSDIPPVCECGGAEIAYIRRPELPCASVVGLTGDPGCGKSSLATAWARDGGVPALLLDRENPRPVIEDRLRRLGATDGPMLRICGGWGPYEVPMPDSPLILDWVKTCEPRPLVVVDSLSAFFIGNQNDAGEMRGFLHSCRRLADYGATVLVLHHSGKSDTARDYRGSSDFPAAIDQGFHCTSFGAGLLDRLVLRCYKSRFGFTGELKYDYAGGRFVRGEACEARETVSEQLTSVLRLNPGVTARKFDELAQGRGLGRQRARTFLSECLLSGVVRRERGSGNTWRHYLVVEAPSAT